MLSAPASGELPFPLWQRFGAVAREGWWREGRVELPFCRERK